MQCLWTFCWFGGGKRIVNMHGRQIPHTIKYLVRMDVRAWEKSSTVFSNGSALGRQAKYIFKAVVAGLPAPGSDPKSEPDGFSVYLDRHKQLMGHHHAFLSAPLLPCGAQPLKGGWRGQDSTWWSKRGGFSFRPVPEHGSLWALLCLWFPGPMVHQIK